MFCYRLVLRQVIGSANPALAPFRHGNGNPKHPSPAFILFSFHNLNTARTAARRNQLIVL